jgi:uncharacterized Zn finger protein
MMDESRETFSPLMAALHERRRTANERNEIRAPKAAVRGGPNDADVPPLEDCVAAFWSEQKPLGGIGVSKDRPYVDAAVIQRLGEPPFWREPEDFTELMKGVYQGVTSKALQLTFS